jgi:hypothetical protein
MSKKWFTLIEILLVLSGFVMLIGVIFGIYQRFFRVKANVWSKQLIIEQSYYTVERLHTMLADLTIDYEEYRNRRIVWCESTSSYTLGPDGYCDVFTHYGNASPTTTTHNIYYCSSAWSQVNPLARQIIPWAVDSCIELGPQSFGQYAEHFRDRWDDISGDGNVIWDDDDEDLGKGPVAILDPDSVPELYLISQDNTQRLFIRRSLVETGDDDQKRYTLQILRLQWLDAWSNHDFSPWDTTVYDGQIDTRACDAAQWFFCSGQDVWGAYSWFRLPSNVDDGRVDLLDERITLLDRKLQIYPTSNPDYGRADTTIQIQPYIRIFLQTALYPPAWPSVLESDLMEFSFPIQTTFNIRTWYTR